MASVKVGIFNSDDVNIGIGDRGHLVELDRGDTSVGVEDEDGDRRLGSETVDGGTGVRDGHCERRDLPSGITRRSTNNGQLLLFAILFILVPPLEEIGKDISQELQSDILERPCRSMPQLHDILVALGLTQRSGQVCPESRVRLVDELFQVGFWDIRSRDKEGQDGVGKFGKRVVGPLGLPVGWQGRDMVVNVETGISSSCLGKRIGTYPPLGARPVRTAWALALAESLSLSADLFKGEFLRASSGRKVLDVTLSHAGFEGVITQDVQSRVPMMYRMTRNTRISNVVGNDTEIWNHVREK